jgi:hypothetical protein
VHNEGRTALAAAAFGAGSAGPLLAVPSSAAESWWRAVALGGAGYYARARTELTRTRRMATGHAEAPAAVPEVPAHAALMSLSLSTRASWLRQLGWHRHAAELDGAALARTPRDPAFPGRSDAVCDALIGLAADALGQGRLALGDRLLDRCRGVLADSAGERAPSARIPIRLEWVCAELAMAGGRADQARRFAGRAVALAEESESVRHRVKSALLLAAAQCAQGDVDAARAGALAVRAQCRDHGLLPLEWAAAMLLTALVEAADRADLRADVDVCAAELARRGGVLRAM